MKRLNPYAHILLQSSRYILVALMGVMLPSLFMAGCSDRSSVEPASSSNNEPASGEIGALHNSNTDSGQFRIKVLGSAQDGGLHHAACGCVRCEAAARNPELARNIAAVAILSQATGNHYLVDAGPDIRPQLDMLARVGGGPQAKVDRAPVDGVFLTHAHLGHYTGLAFFGVEAIHTADLPVWCTRSMADLLRENAPWSQLVQIGNIDLKEILPREPFEPEPGVTVTAIPVPHRDEFADTVAFLITGSRKTIFYAPDTDSWDRWDPSLPEVLAAVDIAILDGTFFSPDELPGRRVEEIGHPLITSTMDLLQSMVDQQQVQVWFTHMNHSNPVLGPDPHAADEVRDRGFHILEDGQEFPL